MSLLVSIAWTHVRTRLRQTFVGIFAVATGVGFTIMMAGIMQGSQEDFLRQLVDAMPHVTVTDEYPAPPTQPAERNYAAVQMANPVTTDRRAGIRYPNAVVSSIESWLPGAVAPTVKTTAIVSNHDSRIGVTLMGIDPSLEFKVSKLPAQMVQGRLNDLSKVSNGVIIGESLAQKLGVKSRGSILLSGGENIQLSATIAGTFHSGVKQLDDGQIYSEKSLAQIFFGQGGGAINQLRIRLQNPLKAKEIADQIEAQVGYKAVSWQEANADLLSTFKVRDFIMLTVMSAMLLVSSFGTYNIISTITYEKRHDIAIMKSFGMKEHLVRRIFIIESALIGLVGIIGGWAIGYLLCSAMSKITFFNPITGATVPIWIHYSVTQYLVVGGISLACCAFAAFFPARKATRANPVDIIRGAS